MKKNWISAIGVSVMLACSPQIVCAQAMNELWGSTESAKKEAGETNSRTDFFSKGNYAMFIHWGMYSQIANRWKGKTYYGIGEWIMNKGMAGIPYKEYMAAAADFNPQDFDARAIARLAKEAGMKYIVVTSKHHDGFAMFDSKVCDFNIVKRTPFGRDPLKELSEACREYGLGLGFYYSHNQDWTYPGGTGGPQTDDQGHHKTFDDYFNEKCLPQIEEITRNYGPIRFVWFDTPGGMPKKYAAKLVEVVHHNQPLALVSSRVGYGMGDFQTLGDMEVPLENIDGLWESIDTTNDSWAYAWYDQNWKTPSQILQSLVNTVGRGGTFMVNVGPDGKGVIPAPAQSALLTVGHWVAAHPYVVYDAGASPWRHALPWGDVTTNGGALYLSVFKWPEGGKLYIPGVLSEVGKVELMEKGRARKLKYVREGNWLVVTVPMPAPDKLATVLRLTPARTDSFRVDPTQAVDPERGLTVSVKFANVTGGRVQKRQWMCKFGEWKTAYSVRNWTDSTRVTWDIDVKEAGSYQLDLSYSGKARMVWRIDTEEGTFVQNQQGANADYMSFPMGQVTFAKPGKHRLTVRMIEGDMKSADLTSLTITPVMPAGDK